MKINIEELEEDKKVKLVTQLVTREITHKDVADGQIQFCEDCKQWEAKRVFYECTLAKAFKSFAINFDDIPTIATYSDVERVASIYGFPRQISIDGSEETDTQLRNRMLEILKT